MRFLVLLNESDPSAWERATAEERQEVFEAHGRFDAELRERGALVAGEALARADESRFLSGGAPTEGPFTESAEHLVGFYLVDLPDHDTAVELSRLLPRGYDVEVRPAVDIEGYDD